MCTRVSVPEEARRSDARSISDLSAMGGSRWAMSRRSCNVDRATETRLSISPTALETSSRARRPLARRTVRVSGPLGTSLQEAARWNPRPCRKTSRPRPLFPIIHTASTDTHRTHRSPRHPGSEDRVRLRGAGDERSTGACRSPMDRSPNRRRCSADQASIAESGTRRCKWVRYCLLAPQCDQRVHPRRPPRRCQTRHRGHRHQDPRDGEERCGVGRLRLEQDRPEHSGSHVRADAA